MAEPSGRDHAAPGAATEIGSLPTDTTAGVRGTVRIAPTVLVELIELSVRDVPGVAAFGARRRVESNVADDGREPTAAWEAGPRSAKTYEAGGVTVRVAGDRIDADVSIVVHRGANVSELGRAIQRRVGLAAGRMLGMTVTEVNVYVTDIVDEPDGEG